MKLICAGITDVGCAREHNEDDFYLSEGSEAICIVADGMGGHSSGEVASALAIRAIIDYYRETIPEADKRNGTDVESGESSIDFDRERLAEALKMANRAVFEMASQNIALNGMGTTIVSAFFTSEGVYLGHVGDSRAYRYRGGKLEQLTLDHSLVNEYVQMGILAEEHIESFPYKNVITRACGLSEHVEIDLAFQDVEPGDLFLLCTDGLSDMVRDKDIQAIIEDEPDLEALAYRLVEQANANGGDDNITIILARAEE